jgi:hypothetical protein
MKLIKSYKLFLEKLITDPNRLLAPQMDLYHQSIELFHVGEHIWAVKVRDSHSRAMLFLRPQEFYESAFEEIISKQFKFSRFQELYKQHYGKQEFTYGSDWSGFNIPSTILEECMFNIPEDEINTYDKIMLSIIKTIKEVEGDSKYYLLGVDELSNRLLEHEFAHAMWFTLTDYKEDMSKLNNECDGVVKDSMFKCITDYGYADHVLPDELQAYMATGLGSKMEEMEIPNIEEWQEKYKSVFDQYYSKSLYSDPKKVEINFDTKKI